MARQQNSLIDYRPSDERKDRFEAETRLSSSLLAVREQLFSNEIVTSAINFSRRVHVLFQVGDGVATGRRR